MKTKENKKRQILSDEELKGVVGGLVQLINPSSSRCDAYVPKKECSKYKDWRSCSAYNHCRWRLFKRICIDK